METLQLQLHALEAKLKLKRLQQKKHRGVSSNLELEKEGVASIKSARKENVPPQSQRQHSLERSALARRNISRDFQIPVSPQRKHQAVEEARSPGRVLLGIDKGLKGKNISLRRAPGDQAQNEDPFLSNLPPSARSRNLGQSQKSTAQLQNQLDKPKSFSARIAESRQVDKDRDKRAASLRKQQSTGFGLQQEQIQSAARRAESLERQKHHESRKGAVEFSRAQILEAANRPESRLIRRSNTASTLNRIQKRGNTSNDVWQNPNAEPEAPKLSRTTSNTSKQRARSQSPPKKSAEDISPSANLSTSDTHFEFFSSLHLAKRLLPHDLLTKTFSQKSILRLPDLLGAVKSPDYSLPEDLEADYVVLAVIASKSCPLTHKDAQKTNNSSKRTATSTITEAAESEQNTKGKYMVITLTDLKWTVDLYLFTTAFTRFWKLDPGTVVALLNPSIMPPPPGKTDTGRFSLTLNSSDDTVLEIGTSRDLGWCKSVKKDGKPCTSWIDKRHTEFCEFHIDRVIERTRRGRMEVQGMSAPFAPGGRKSGRTGFFSDKKRGDGKSSKVDGFAKEGPQYDRSSGSTYFVAPMLPGRSAAQLLDADGAIERGGSREERTRRRLAALEKEKEIARKLGEGGNGAGSEYLRLRNGDSKAYRGHGTGMDMDEPVDATSLGLRGNKAKEVHLSPIKKRKAGVFEGVPSARKKTRFMTERGIREAGRESLGVAGEEGDAGEGQKGDDDDDDDELEVV